MIRKCASLYRHLHKYECTFTAETLLDRLECKERILWLKASPFYDQTHQITGAIEIHQGYY